MLGVLSRCQRLGLTRALVNNAERVLSRQQIPAQSPLCRSCLRCESRRFASTEDAGKKKKVPITWKSLGITFAIGGALLGWMLYVKKEKQREMDRERKRSLGKAAIGGSFDLVDHTGQPKKSQDFFGKWVLIYFGFTHCPDICPDELEKLGKVIDIVDKEIKDVELQPLFISIDPERDDVKAVAAYHGVGCIGCQILDVTTRKANVTDEKQIHYLYGSRRDRHFWGTADCFSVDHTVIMYLIDPDGEFVDYYGQNRTARQIATAIQMQDAKYKHAKGGAWF
ncbi:unnamed protein product [Ixodes hexagonus]